MGEIEEREMMNLKTKDSDIGEKELQVGTDRRAVRNSEMIPNQMRLARRSSPTISFRKLSQ